MLCIGVLCMGSIDTVAYCVGCDGVVGMSCLVP